MPLIFFILGLIAMDDDKALAIIFFLLAFLSMGD